jgi:spermidine/putrescine transport system ATP-binding protein
MSEQDRTPAIRVERVTRDFGTVIAVDDVSLEIEEGEFFSLLGPSGCGKTTLLRMLAGFELPDAGRVLLRGQDVTHRPPHKRDVNTVFQSYELFPHMTVAENVAYGLKLRKVPKGEIRERVAAMLELVGVGDLGARHANQLSGGQQQRVALARALVNRPAVLLLDEPLSALDVKLRKRMQLELKAIQREIGTTFVYVTHDQEEALFLSDRIAIMSAGKLLQVGAPRAVYERPEHPFVADFVGSLNELAVVVDTLEQGTAVVRGEAGDRIRVPVANGEAPGSTLRLAIRPERMRVAAGEDGAEGSRLRGTVESVVYLGPMTHVVVDTRLAGRIVVHELSDPARPAPAVGDEVAVVWPDDAAILLDPDPR